MKFGSRLLAQEIELEMAILVCEKSRKYEIPTGHKWCSGGPKQGLVGGCVQPAVQSRKYEIPAGHKLVFGGSQTQFGRRRRTPAVQSRKYERLRKSRVGISEEKVECFC